MLALYAKINIVEEYGVYVDRKGSEHEVSCIIMAEDNGGWQRDHHHTIHIIMRAIFSNIIQITVL